jgi:hypothetical protein
MMRRRKAWQAGWYACGVAWILCFFVLATAPGCVRVPMMRGARTAVFDCSHEEKSLPTDTGNVGLSDLAAEIKNAGLEVGTNDGPITDEALAGIDALIISGPLAPLTREEVEATSQFISKGGRLCVMLDLAWPARPLLDKLGVPVSKAVIQERENIIGDMPLNFRVTGMADHPITEGLVEFDLFGAWALLARGENVQVIAQTSPAAWLDLDGNARLSAGDAVQSFAVAVAGTLDKGRFVVFGDDSMFQNSRLTERNRELARNLARWLAD